MTTVFETMLNNTFFVYRKTSLADGQGGWINSLSTVGTVRGRMRPTSSTERVTAQGEEQKVDYVLYTLAGEDVEKGDIILIGDLSTEVVAVREPSLAGAHYEIDLYEIQHEVIT